MTIKEFIPLCMALSLVFHGCRKDTDGDTIKTSSFVKLYGGTGRDFGTDVLALSDGGYIIAATKANAQGVSQAAVVKTDEFGNEIWLKTFTVPGAISSECVRIKEVPSGFAVLFNTVTYSGGADIAISLITADGIETKSAVLGDAKSQIATDLVVYSTGSIIKLVVLGSTDAANVSNGNPDGSADILLTELDNSLNVLWQKSVGGPGDDYGNRLTRYPDGSMAVLGSTSSYGNGGFDLFLVTVNANGNILNFGTYGTTGNEYGSDMIAVASGGYSLLCTAGDKQNANLSLVTANQALTEFSLRATLPGTLEERAGGMVMNDDNSITISASTESQGNGAFDQYIVNVTAGWIVDWEVTYGGAGDDFARQLVRGSANEFVITGSSEFEENSMITLIKVTETGKLRTN